MHGFSGLAGTLRVSCAPSRRRRKTRFRPMPASLIASTWPLLLGMGVLMLGAGLQSTLLGVRAQTEGFATAAIGIVMSCYYVGFLVGTVIAPRPIRGVCFVRVCSA